MTVLYFTADWCPGCKIFKPVVQQVSQELGVTVNYINVDYDASLAQKHKVSSIPTIVAVGQSGSELFRHTGPMLPNQLKDIFNRLK